MSDVVDLCPRCGLQVIWAVADDGRRVAFDPHPRDDGAWVLWWLDEGTVRTDRSGAIVADGELNATARRAFNERFSQWAAGPLYTAHRTTCPSTVVSVDFGKRQGNLFGRGKGR